MPSKTAFITGITGQDGSYLAELLLEKGYKVHGLVRRSSTITRERIDHLVFNEKYKTKLFLHYGDLADSNSLVKLLEAVQPEEIYHLGAQSHVQVSFEIPEYTADVSGLSTVRILEAMRILRLDSKFYQASSSELFGNAVEVPQSEKTPFNPASPYACAKAYAYFTTVNYREAYGNFAANGILFNHESPRRGESFLSRKVTIAAAQISLDRRKKLYLGNLDAKRDWGYAKEYVEAMWLILQQSQPQDYVIATGESYSVRDFLDEAFGYLDLDWQEYVEIDSRLFRAKEVEILIGDASKAKRELGWEPKVKFKKLVRLMVDADIALCEKQMGGANIAYS